jgi:hypothetical protein
MDKETGKRNIRNALVILSVDGNIAEKEKDYLRGLRRSLGIDEHEFTALIEEFKQDPKRLSIPRGEEGSEALRQMVEAAASDGKITIEERTVLAKVARHVGISEVELDSLIPVDHETADRIEEMVGEIYASFNSWDSAARAKKVEAIAVFGQDAVVPLLQVLESYRVPDGAENALDLKTLVAGQLGGLGDPRAVYYLAQQVNIGDTDDEISNPAFRNACADALGAIIGMSFEGEDRLGEVLEWWLGPGKDDYSELAI